LANGDAHWRVRSARLQRTRSRAPAKAARCDHASTDGQRRIDAADQLVDRDPAVGYHIECGTVGEAADAERDVDAAHELRDADRPTAVAVTGALGGSHLR